MENAGEKVHFKVMKKERGEVVNSKNMLLSRLGNIFLLVVSFFLIYNVFKSVDLTAKKIAILNQAQQEVDDLRLKNISLILSREEVETDDYIETESRDRLNLAKEGELVFVIPDELLDKGYTLVEKILNSQHDVVEVKSGYEQWYEALLGG